SAEAAKRRAIRPVGPGETAFNNKVLHNTTEGSGLPIPTYHKDSEVSCNVINNCNPRTQSKEAEDLLIQDNTISNVSSGRGISGQLQSGKNIQILNNEINVQKNSIYFVELNKESSTKTDVTIEGNTFLGKGSSVISHPSSVVFKGNDSK